MKHTVKEIVLSNGVKGLLINVPDATVMQYKFHFRAGNKQVKDKSIYETAHLMEHMAFGANSKYDSEIEYSAEFSKNGAHNNAFTSDDAMVYVGACPDFEWDRILKLQQLAICSPKFKPEKLETEKGNVRNELNGMLSDHTNLLWYKMQQVLGEDILSIEERLKTIDNITVDDIKDHHKQTHTLNNMSFIIAGKITNRERKIKKILESWRLPKGELIEIKPDQLKSSEPQLIKQENGRSITFGLSIMLDRVLERNEKFALGALNHILTGTSHSKIFGKAREKGLVYSVYSDFMNNHHNTAWDFSGQVMPETAEALFDLIVEELNQVIEGNISKKEMEATKSYGLGSHQMSNQTVGQLAGFYSGAYFRRGEVLSYSTVPNYISKTSKEQIVELAKEFVTEGKWAFVAVGNTDQKLVDKLNQKLKKVLN